ncbi:MAG: hypothetical protein ACRDL8_03410, partial [Solirubrobacteraceae bacterium]
MAEVTITRTLFRSGDSEYAINGTPCRLLDIQDLLSDSGVGRQQHMIIGQGQLDTVLNARPEDRRAIIEEAAGVLKHRRRRERAERRLAATQENLERLGDLVREVRRQIRPLERQAAAARSYTTLVDELRTVRLHLAGSELNDLGRRRTEATEALDGMQTRAREQQDRLTELDSAASATAAELSSRREEDLATALGRVQGLVERARGTAGVLRERSRALLVALDAAADVDVVSTLEAEGARLAEKLRSAEADLAALEPEHGELDAADASLVDDERAHLVEWGDGSELSDAEEALALAQGRRGPLRRALEQSRLAATAVRERAGELEVRQAAATSHGLELIARREELAAEAARRAAAAASADGRTAAAAARLADAQREVDSAEHDRHRGAARAEALARTLAELQGAGGREVLAGVDGVVGSLVDLVTLDAGWETAFEAAAGAAVAAVVVEGRDAAHEALSRLRRGGVAGSVLAAGGRDARRSVDVSGLPGVEPLRAHVHGRRPGLEGVLDALVGRAVRARDWEQAIDLSLDRPDLVVVTTDGDRFAESGWRVRSGSGVVTAAAVEAAEGNAARATTIADAAAGRLEVARQDHESARQVSIDAARAIDRHESERRALEVDVHRSE